MPSDRRSSGSSIGFLNYGVGQRRQTASLQATKTEVNPIPVGVLRVQRHDPMAWVRHHDKYGDDYVLDPTAPYEKPREMGSGCCKHEEGA